MSSLCQKQSFEDHEIRDEKGEQCCDCEQVSPPDTRGERNAASRPLQHSLSLTQLVYALPELRSLNVRKAANDRDSRRPDLWTPACYSSLSEIMRAMRKHSPWCNLETFVCDPVPMPHDSTSWLGTALAE